MLNLKQASKALGIGRETIRKGILAGELLATEIIAPGGKAYLVTLEDAQAWFEARPVRTVVAAPEAEVAATSSLVASEGVAANRSVAASEQPLVPLAAHLAALEHSSQYAHRLLDQMTNLQQQIDQARASQSAAERRAEQLMGELGGYRRVLEQQAQSLAEQRALAMTAEAQLLAVEPKVDTARTPRGWGNRFKGLLFRKLG